MIVGDTLPQEDVWCYYPYNTSEIFENDAILNTKSGDYTVAKNFIRHYVHPMYATVRYLHIFYNANLPIINQLEVNNITVKNGKGQLTYEQEFMSSNIVNLSFQDSDEAYTVRNSLFKVTADTTEWNFSNLPSYGVTYDFGIVKIDGQVHFGRATF